METNLFWNIMVPEMEFKNWLEVNAGDNKKSIIKNQKKVGRRKKCWNICPEKPDKLRRVCNVGIYTTKIQGVQWRIRKTSKKHSLPKHSENDYEIVLEAPEKLATSLIYNINEEETKVFQVYIKRNLKKGYIKYSKSKIAQPVMFVPKKKRGIENVCWLQKNKYGDGQKQISITINGGYENKIQGRTIFHNFGFTKRIQFYQSQIKKWMENGIQDKIWDVRIFGHAVWINKRPDNDAKNDQ